MWFRKLIELENTPWQMWQLGRFRLLWNLHLWEDKVGLFLQITLQIWAKKIWQNLNDKIEFTFVNLCIFIRLPRIWLSHRNRDRRCVSLIRYRFQRFLSTLDFPISFLVLDPCGFRIVDLFTYIRKKMCVHKFSFASVRIILIIFTHYFHNFLRTILTFLDSITWNTFRELFCEYNVRHT